MIRLGVPALLVAWTALAPPPSAEGPAPVLPRNVLAHEEFLASDALHGIRYQLAERRVVVR